MKLVKYNKKFDQKLMDLFYKSIFFERDEIEYVKEPSWNWRYNQFHKHIHLLEENGSIVGSIGALPTNILINNKKYRAAVIVDNCIDPSVKNYQDTIRTLFKKSIESLNKDNFDIAVCWEYEKRYMKYKKVFDELDFSPIKDVNWSIAGIEYNNESPRKWRGKNKTLTKIFYHLMKVHNSLFLNRKTSKIEGVIIKDAEPSDINNIAKYFNKNHSNNRMEATYTKEEITNLSKNIGLKFILAIKNNKIIGAVSYFVSPWTGMMYGKPTENDWEKFYTLTIDDFIVDKEYHDTPTPNLLMERLISYRYKHPKTRLPLSGMIVDLVDKNDIFRKKIFDKYGFLQPSFDKGVFLVKKMNEKIKISNDISIHVPNRTIIAPIPMELQ